MLRPSIQPRQITATPFKSGLICSATSGEQFNLLDIEAAPYRHRRSHYRYFDATIPGGFHVPSPAGKIDGGESFGQYKRITK
jgi:hypothetical protein